MSCTDTDLEGIPDDLNDLPVEDPKEVFSPDRIKEEMMKRIAAEQGDCDKTASSGDTETQPELKPLFQWKDISAGRFYGKEPPPVEYILDGYLRKGLVGALFGTGGSGKSFFIAQLGACIAGGIKFGVFNPTQARRVIMLCAEDDENIIHERINDFLRELNINDLRTRRLISENFGIVSVCGMDKYFFENLNNNIVTSSFYRQLNHTCKILKPELLIIDPLSRFFGLNENDSSDATRFVSALEVLSHENNGMNILFCHHENKMQAQSGNLKTSSGRGSSAFKDGIRFCMSMAQMDENTAKINGLNARDHIILDITKSNNSKKLPSIVAFKRNPDSGVLSFIDLGLEKMCKEKEILTEAFSNLPENLTLHDIMNSRPGDAKRDIVDEVKSVFVRACYKVRDIPELINRGLKMGILRENKVEIGKTIRKEISIYSDDGTI